MKVMSFAKFNLRLVLIAATAGIAVLVGTAWLNAQSKTTAVGQFDAVAATPPYIVVSTSTPVLFTAKITDPQLKRRSVILLRVDASGQPTDILGRLRDDGATGDVKANDNIYSLRTTLNEPTVGSATFRIAARFKPGKWKEPEADDDDWDKDLPALGQGGRDRPLIRALLLALLKRLPGKYMLSDPIRVDVGSFALQPISESRLGVSFMYPSGWLVSNSDPNSPPELTISMSSASAGPNPEDFTGTCLLTFFQFAKSPSESLNDWRNALGTEGVIHAETTFINTRQAIREHADEMGVVDTYYIAASDARVLALRMQCGSDTRTVGTEALERVVSTLQFN